MRKPVVFVIAMAGTLAACLIITSSSAAAVKRTAAPKAETYLVVQIGDDIPKIVKKSDLTKLSKDAAQKYKEEMKKYTEDRKAAAKSKDKSTDKASEKPVKSKVVNLAKKTFKTEDEAKAWLESHSDSKKDQPKTGNKVESTTDKKPAAQ